MRVALAITCGNRLQHLRQTLPSSLRSNPSALFVLLDYGSKDGLGHYIWKHHRADIASGQLVYYQHDAPHFRMAHAKNMAHRLAIREGADILVNLDADNWTGPDFAGYVAEKFKRAEDDNDAVFLRSRVNHVSPGHKVQERMPYGAGGRIAVTVNAFLAAGGYDECFEHWSPDDKDFADRLVRMGYTRSGIARRYLHVINHSDDLRYKNFGPGVPRTREYVTQAFPLRGREGVSVVNFGRIGLGTVRRNFSPEPIELKPLPTRVFGIGMNKTATTSLAAALRILGYDGAHWQSPRQAKWIYEELKAKGKSRTLEAYYCIGDMPCDFMFRELDQAYPGSKFILTVRDENVWLKSIERYFAKNAANWAHDEFTDQVHRLIYGRADFNAETFLARYNQHNGDVIRHFRGRDDLLVMDMSDGAGWAELCGFLGRPIPDMDYPREFVSESPGSPETTMKGFWPVGHRSEPSRPS